MVNDGRPDNGHRGLPRLGGAYASDAVAGDLLGERVRSLVNAAANGALWVPVCGAGSPVGMSLALLPFAALSPRLCASLSALPIDLSPGGDSYGCP